nr:MAG TPA: hypothetical protein [Caudoviricetes sp.]
MRNYLYIANSFQRVKHKIWHLLVRRIAPNNWENC